MFQSNRIVLQVPREGLEISVYFETEYTPVVMLEKTLNAENCSFLPCSIKYFSRKKVILLNADTSSFMFLMKSFGYYSVMVETIEG